MYFYEMLNLLRQDRDLEANGGGTDFSADTLISGNKQRSTIQWIGGAPPIASSSSSSSSATSSSSTAAAAALSVPSLLRQLYASRESVIRANVHAAAAAAAAGRSTASGYHFSNGNSMDYNYFESVHFNSFIL